MQDGNPLAGDGGCGLSDWRKQWQGAALGRSGTRGAPWRRMPSAKPSWADSAYMACSRQTVPPSWATASARVTTSEASPWWCQGCADLCRQSSAEVLGVGTGTSSSMSEARVHLNGFAAEHVRRMRVEFGLLPIEEQDRARSPVHAFFASRAWTGLVQWVGQHPRTAKRIARFDAYLSGWHDHACATLCQPAP